MGVSAIIPYPSFMVTKVGDLFISLLDRLLVENLVFVENCRLTLYRENIRLVDFLNSGILNT